MRKTTDNGKQFIKKDERIFTILVYLYDMIIYLFIYQPWWEN